MDAQPVQFDVFLCHAHVDAEAVEALGARLSDEDRLNVWLDRWVLVPGERWQQHIARALEQAQTCAVCIGQNTPAGWFREEIEKAIDRQTRTDGFRVIPVILPGGRRDAVDGFLPLRTWVDFSAGVGDGRAFHYLRCGIRGIPPGRYEPQVLVRNDNMDALRAKLQQIRQLHQESLIDKELAIEYQRRVMDNLFDPKG